MNKLEKFLNIAVKVIAVLIIFLLVKSTFGLFYWRMTHLSDDDLAWIKTIAQKTSHDMFVSESAPPLKLRINNVWISNDGNPFFFSAHGGDVFEANAGYSYVLTGDCKEIEGGLYIERNVDVDSLTIAIRLHDLRTVDSNGHYTSLPLATRKMELNGKVFDDCICSDSIHWRSNPYHNKSDTLKVDKLIVSKKYGLIYFRYSDGTEYYRDFK